MDKKDSVVGFGTFVFQGTSVLIFSCCGITLVSSQAPTQPITHSHIPSGLGERRKSKSKKLVGRDEDSLVGEGNSDNLSPPPTNRLMPSQAGHFGSQNPSLFFPYRHFIAKHDAIA